MRAAFAFFVATALATAPAFAQDDDTQGPYFGIGLGDVTDGYETADFDEANLDFEADATASKLFAGWRLNRLMAVQVDRVDFERSTDGEGAGAVTMEVEGFAPSLVGTLPLGPLELFARAGIFWYDLEIARNDTSIAASSDRDPIFGAGIGFTIAERVNLRAEYEVVEIDGVDDPNAVWVTAAWRF